MQTKSWIRRLKHAILLPLLFLATGSQACRFLPRVPRDHIVRVAPLPPRQIVSALKGETVSIAPGSGFISDSYIIECRIARVSDKSYTLHPIGDVDFIVNHSSDTMIIVPKKNGWVATWLYLSKVEKIQIVDIESPKRRASFKF